MQTLQQKREYTVAVLDPAGNVTAIVCSDVPAAERARVAAQILRLPELGIEQVAFLTAPRSGGEIRLEMMGGEFCGNALRCAGFYQALRNGAQGKSCVFAEISGADGIHGDAAAAVRAAGRLGGRAGDARDLCRHHALCHRLCAAG